MQFKKTLELDGDFAPAHISLSAVYFVMDRYAECVEEFARYEELFNRPQNAALARETFAKSGWQAFVRLMADENKTSSGNSYFAAIYRAELGERDSALAALNDAYEQRIYRVGHIKVDPRLDPLRDDPRFKDLLKRMNLPE